MEKDDSYYRYAHGQSTLADGSVRDQINKLEQTRRNSFYGAGNSQYGYSAPTYKPNGQSLDEINGQIDSLKRQEFRSTYGDLDYVDESDPQFANKMQAAMDRAQFEEWKGTFLPIEREIVDDLNNGVITATMEMRANNNVHREFDKAAQQRQIRNRQYGITMNDQEKQSVDSQSKLALAAARNNAVNRARRSARDVRMDLMA